MTIDSENLREINGILHVEPDKEPRTSSSISKLVSKYAIWKNPFESADEILSHLWRRINEAPPQ